MPILGEPGQMGRIGGGVTTVVAQGTLVRKTTVRRYLDLKPKRAAAVPLAYYWLCNGRYSSS